MAETRSSLKEFTIYDGEIQRVSYLVETAGDERSRRRGLMYREILEANHAMLLKYRSEKQVAIWMKNTYISLDILFIDRDGYIVKIHEAAEPLSTESIYSEQRVISVLEINAGQVKEHGIKVGDRLTKTSAKEN